MNISLVSSNVNFEGKVIIKNKISTSQNYLFNLHKKSLDNMIKEMPFDLLIEQSKSKKTISVTTNVENAFTYAVKKNEQNFEEIANYAISDAKSKSEVYKKFVKTTQMFNYSKNNFINIICGDFKQARESEKELAKLAVADFEAYKDVPIVSFTNVPNAMAMKIIINGIKYRIYKAFCSKTPEEKQFLKMRKEYLKELKSENKQLKKVTIPLPPFYL